MPWATSCASASGFFHNSGACRVDVHANTVTGALDLDTCHAGAVKRRFQQVADLDVFGDEVAVALTDLS